MKMPRVDGCAQACSHISGSTFVACQRHKEEGALRGVVGVQARVAQRYVGRARLHPLLPRLLLQPAGVKEQKRPLPVCPRYHVCGSLILPAVGARNCTHSQGRRSPATLAALALFQV
jgi:hypothetical protein